MNRRRPQPVPCLSPPPGRAGTGLAKGAEVDRDRPELVVKEPPRMPHPPRLAERLSKLGSLALVTCVLAGLAGCKQEPPPGADDRAEAAARPQAGQAVPTLPPELAPRKPTEPAASAGEPTAAPSAEPPAPAAEPYSGPYLVVTESSAGVYAETSNAKKQKVGYLRSGSRVPVFPETIRDDDCPRGWYRIRDGGFVCGNAGTTNPTAPEARFAIRAPNWDSVLPYTYARNSKNGTPLYRSVPTLEQMREYEPYLVKKEDDKGSEKRASSADPAQKSDSLPFSKERVEQKHPDQEQKHDEVLATTQNKLEKAAPTAPAEHAASPESPDGGVDESTKPWWQRRDVDKRLNELKLDELEADADAILAKRMVKGFYVAVDREFNWNGRPWYKTTKGLVAPADRFWVTQASEFHGAELDGEHLALPVGFTYGWQKSRTKYELDPSGKLKPAGTVEHHAMVALTGKETTIGGKKYVEGKDGFWMQASQLRITNPGPPPSDLAPDERWVDVNLTTQTLVAFEGTRAVYATLISSGKENKTDKDKDHSTPTGDYRIREKHVTTTMDGDGSAAGDLPYSIEDVPYVMYFHKAYALHGAFWHSNYGSQMSHGCVNLSPLDAKWVFRFTEPHLPEGWHGVLATAGHPGSRVIVHD